MCRLVNDGTGNEENAVMKKVTVENRPHLALFAKRDILAGEEIRYSYGDNLPNTPWREQKRKKIVS